MVKVYINGMIQEDMKVCMKMIMKMVKEHLYGIYI